MHVQFSVSLSPLLLEVVESPLSFPYVRLQWLNWKGNTAATKVSE